MRTPLLFAGLILLILITFSPVLGNGFIILDDGLLIYENNAIREFSLSNLYTVFTSFDPELYIPLTILSYKLDYLLGGYHPFMYHLSNLLLHALSVLLVYFFAKLLTKKKFIALFTAVFFAVHPLQVEAVAWAAARKDVLSSLFFFAALVGYLLYRKSGGKLWRPYILSVGCFLLGLLAKVSIIMLPFVLLLIDFYEGRKLSKKMIIEKLPFFTLSVIFGIIAMLGKARRLEEVSLIAKMVVAPKTTIFYLQKFLLPFHLTVFYPQTTDITILSREFFVPAALLLLFLCALIFLMRRSGRDALFAVLFFFIMLFPSYFVISKGMDIFFASDRYVYIPIVGLLLLCGGLLERFVRSGGDRMAAKRMNVVGISSVTVATAFMALSFSQSLLWGSSTALFERAVARAPEFAPGHVNLSICYRQDKNLEAAKEQLLMALAIDQTPATHGLLGQIHAEQGNFAAAVEELRAGIAMAPEHYELHHGLGQIYELQGRTDDALATYEHAVSLMPLPTRRYDELARKLAPRRDVVYERIGNLYGKRGDHKKAIEYYVLAVEENPYYADAHYNMAVALGSLGRMEEAITQYEKAITLGPWHVKALVNLGIIEANRGARSRAVELLERALEAEPGNAVARGALKTLGEL